MALIYHQNDHIFISHFHDTTDGYVYLEDTNDWLSDGQMSASSVIHKPDTQLKKRHPSIDRTVTLPISHKLS